MTAWVVERLSGAAGDLHARPLPDPFTRQLWVLEADQPALVLGSTQPMVAAAGVPVVRRHSGGGGVLLVPGEHVWVDVFVPRDDPLWDDDVGRAAWWVGDAWAAAIGAGATTHKGPMRTDPLARRVCFAGLGPGEVTVDGRKVVGISQRRTRAGARFQCVALRRWDPEALAALVGVDPDDLRDLAAGVAVRLADVLRELGGG